MKTNRVEAIMLFLLVIFVAFIGYVVAFGGGFDFSGWLK